MKRYLLLLAIFLGLSPIVASAHEAYVLPYNTFWQLIRMPVSLNAFNALKNPNDLRVTLIIMGATCLGLILNLLLRRTSLGEKLHHLLDRFSRFGPHFIRVTMAVAFLFSAWTYRFLGPELYGSLLPFSKLVQFALFVIGIMILLGVFTEIAALIGIILYVVSYFVFGPYILTYLNYLGELIVLLLFGLRHYSVDAKVFGPLKRFKNLEKYETTIVRVFYGLALVYAAVTVKLLHPELTVTVVNTWHLTQFHWLFPRDPLLITLGAGIVEVVIGLFIAFGFELRLTVLVSLFYITLSLLYFRELVWPHLLLYGISFNLLVQPENFTLDKFFFKES